MGMDRSANLNTDMNMDMDMDTGMDTVSAMRRRRRTVMMRAQSRKSSPKT